MHRASVTRVPKNYGRDYKFVKFGKIGPSSKTLEGTLLLGHASCPTTDFNPYSANLHVGHASLLTCSPWHTCRNAHRRGLLYIAQIPLRHVIKI